MTELPPDCQAVLDHLDALRRGELPPDDAATLRRHLDGCKRCLCVEQYEQAFLARIKALTRRCSCPEPLRERVARQATERPRDA